MMSLDDLVDNQRDIETCCAMLNRLPTVADATIVSDDPLGEVIEVTTNPQFTSDGLPKEIASVIYRPSRPWSDRLQVKRFEKRTPTEGHYRILIG
ncbi:MAG: hypothetical protein ABEI52_02340 [Halobacteriaceae archaeon]